MTRNNPLLHPPQISWVYCFYNIRTFLVYGTIEYAVEVFGFLLVQQGLKTVDLNLFGFAKSGLLFGF